MTMKEKVNFGYLVIEFKALKKEIFELKTSNSLLNENVTALLQFKKEFDPNNGLITRLMEAVSGKWKEDFAQFKRDNEIRKIL